MDGIVSWLVSAVSGAVGGNVGGMLDKAKNLGPKWNTVLGAIGGLIGGQGLAGLIPALKDMGVGGNIGGSAIVGTIVTFIAGKLKKQTA